MAVTNTVQGMNDTISLLKQILDAVKTGGNNTVQPSDVSSTARTVNNNTDMGNAVNDINAIGRTNKNLVKNVNSFTTAIKSLTSKETLSGITKLAMLKMTGMIKAFGGAVGALVDALNKIDDFKVTEVKLNNFMTAISTVDKVANTIKTAILSLAGIIFISAAIGALIPILWPQILMGFAAIVGICALLLGVIWLMQKLTNFLFGGITAVATDGATSAAGLPGIGNINFGVHVLLFQQMINIFLSIGAMIMIAAGVGLLAQIAMPQILLGFVIITAISFGIMLIIKGISKMVDWIIGAQKGVGGGWMGLTKGSQQSAIRAIGGIVAVAAMVFILYALSLLVVISAGVGLLAMNAFGTIMAGFGTMALILVGLGVIVWLLSKLSKSIDPIKMGVAIGAILALTAVIFVLSITVGIIALVTYGIDKAGGHNKVWHTIGMIGTLLGGMLIIVAALSALVSSGIGAVVIGAAVGILIAITAAIWVLADAIDSIINTSIKIGEANDKGIFNNISQVAKDIGNAIKNLVIGLAPAAKHAKEIRKNIKHLVVIMDVISNFVDLISRIASDKFLTPVTLDKDGNIVKIGKTVDMKIISTNIATAFSTFVTTLHNGFKNLENKQFRQMGRHAKNLNKMIKPISNFVDMISKFASKDGVITLIADAEYNDDGSVSKLSDTKINMQTVAANISQAFITFANTLDNNLTALDIEGKTARSAERLGMIMTPISSLLDVIKNYEFNDNTITYIDENGKKITIDNYNKKIENLGKFISALYSSLKIKDDSNENFFQKLGIGDGTNKLSNLLEAISASSSGIISLMTTTIPDEKQTVWYHFNNIKMSSDNKTPALQKQAELINEFGTAIKNIDDIIFKNDKRRIEAIKKYTEEVTKLATQMSSLAESTKIVANNQIAKNNETPNTNKQNNQQSQVIQQSNAPVTPQNQQNNQSYNNFDYEDLKNAIIDAFSNKQIKVSFDDSLEDLIGDLSLV